MNVNRLEWNISLSTTTTSGRGSVVLSLFLSDVGGPVLFHHGADDDVEHRVLDVLLHQSTESGVIELWRVDGGLVLVGFTIRGNLRARYTRTREEKMNSRRQKIAISNRSRRGRQKNKGRLSYTHRVEFKKV